MGRAERWIVLLATGLGGAGAAGAVLSPAMAASPKTTTPASAAEDARPHAPRAPREPAPPHAAQRPADAAGVVTVWVDLDEPALASLGPGRTAAHDALRARIAGQQEIVMDQLRALGAVEQARIQQVQNALAVRLPGAQLDAARRISGVRAIRRVRDIERDPLVQGK